MIRPVVRREQTARTDFEPDIKSCMSSRRDLAATQLIVILVNYNKSLKKQKVPSSGVCAIAPPDFRSIRLIGWLFWESF